MRRAIEAAQAAAQIPDHPRLDQVFDVFAEGGSLWIVSELVAARPLAALLAETPLNPYRAAEIASDVLTALRVLHAHGWTHRNITARTVLVCDDGRVMLTGLAAGAAEEALCGYDPVPLPDDEPAYEAPGAHGAPAGGVRGPGGRVRRGARGLRGPDVGRRHARAPVAGGRRRGPVAAGRPAGTPDGRGAYSLPPAEATTARTRSYRRSAGQPPQDDASARTGQTGRRPRPPGLRRRGAAGGRSSCRVPPRPPAATPPPPAPRRAGAASAAQLRAARAGAIAAYRAGARAAARVTEDRQQAAGSARGEPARKDGARHGRGRHRPRSPAAARPGPTPRHRAADAHGARRGTERPAPPSAGLPRPRALTGPWGGPPEDPYDDDDDEDDDGGPPPAPAASTSPAPGTTDPAPGVPSPRAAPARTRCAPTPAAPARRPSPPPPACPPSAAPSGTWDEAVAGSRATAVYRGPATALAAERARQARIAVVGPVTERWAPEQAGPVHENWQLAPPIGPATDLWALGALLFRAVQGHAPYPEENAAELVQMVCAEPPAFAEECGPLRPVVESLLRQDPTERPDFEELRGWLRSLVRSAPEPEAGADVVPLPAPSTPPGCRSYAAGASWSAGAGAGSAEVPRTAVTGRASGSGSSREAAPRRTPRPAQPPPRHERAAPEPAGHHPSTPGNPARPAPRASPRAQGAARARPAARRRSPRHLGRLLLS